MYKILLNLDKQDKSVHKLNLDKLAQFTLQNYCKFDSANASINFVSEHKIHELNRDYRNVDKPTDVLSFECDGADDSEFGKLGVANRGSGQQHVVDLGDIFICKEIAQNNCKKFNTSIDSELKLLTVHGMLHLCGFDHVKDDEAEAMETAEENILNKWEQSEKSPDDTKTNKFKSGFIAVVGRPNAGKSTLINKIVGSKVAITSNVAQTTRHRLRAIYNTDSIQAIFVDTPGIHKPHDVLGQELNESSFQALMDVDIVLMLIDASMPVGKGDKWVASQVDKYKCPKICVISKIDKVDDETKIKQAQLASTLANWDIIITSSSKNGHNIDAILEEIEDRLPVGPAWFSREDSTDQPLDVIISEYIREKVIRNLFDEIPHAIGVLVDSSEYVKKNNVNRIFATIYCETESQKGIIIGSKGSMLKRIGTSAREDLEKLLGTKVFLGLHVKVKKNWRKNLNSIKQFGYNS